MKVIIVKDQNAGGKAGYEVFANAIKEGATVFGLATGGTPETTYKEIVKSDLDFSKCTSINLDEYVGLSATDPRSYHHYMQEHLFKNKPFKKSYLPNGQATDENAELKAYDQTIQDNPIDLQLLGIGTNGHIGFNEPGSDFKGQTHKVKLTDSTIAANARYFEDETQVPHYAYSMGIGSIMQAKKILLEAYGENKAEAIAATVQGPVSEECPASILQTHPDVTLIIDEAAAKLLKNK